MTIFKELINIWKSDDLLSQAWDESIEMLRFSEKIFDKSIEAIHSNKSKKEIKVLKQKDKLINDFQQSVRRKVLTHFSVKRNNENIASGLNLIDIVVDAERIGDYCKNISDLSLLLDSELNCEPISDQIQKIEESVSLRFDKTLEGIEKQDELLAKKLLETYKKIVTDISDNIVDGIISNKIQINNTSQSASLVLYARYLKRIGAHLKNITTTIVNPYDKVGYVVTSASFED